MEQGFVLRPVDYAGTLFRAPEFVRFALPALTLTATKILSRGQ